MEKYLPILRSSPFFKGLNDNEILSILHCVNATVISKERDSYIFRAGDSTELMGLAASGCVLVIQEDLWGHRNILSKCHAGDFFGEPYAARPGAVLNISVVADEDCEIIFLNVQRLLVTCPTACEHHQKLIRNLVSVLANKILILNDKITHVGKRTTRDKLLSYLSAESIRHSSLSFDIPFDRQQLADYLCIDRAAMSTEISKLQKEGFIKTNRNHFELIACNDTDLQTNKDCMGVFDEVKERVTAREVMERAGIVFNRNNMCRCPFHQDKTASMKVKPTDKKYFCFGCGENGDAIDFVAKYYNRSPRETAMQIADEFGIIYDSSVRSPPKPVRREKSPMQILEETKTKTYRVLSDYLHLLKEWERNFRPESMEKIDERYVEAVQNREKVEFQLDTLLWGTEDEKEAVIHDLGKGVEDIERRVREYRRNQGTVNHNRQRSCEAVH